MPFLEIPHTADWCLHVWSADLPSLFIDAASGMNYLSGIKIAPHPKKKQVFHTTAPDTESLLVSFLSNLVFFTEHEKIGFTQFSIQLKAHELTATMRGAPLISINKTIKAVTFHNLQIKKNPSGYEVDIVFDV
jgi:SHS2 domain-containing protein